MLGQSSIIISKGVFSEEQILQFLIMAWAKRQGYNASLFRHGLSNL